MKDTGYPDDIRQYDSDPRSPFFDDKGEEVWHENRVNELMENPGELNRAQNSVIVSISIDAYNETDPQAVFSALTKYFEKLANAQADEEWHEDHE